jgi:hypothetical protein
MVELYLHSPIRLHGVVLNYTQVQLYRLPNSIAERVEIAVTLWIHVQEMLGSNLDWDTEYID